MTEGWYPPPRPARPAQPRPHVQRHAPKPAPAPSDADTAKHALAPVIAGSEKPA